MPELPPRTITLSRRVWVAVVAVVALGLAVFIGQLVFIIQQRQLIDHQDAVATHQAARARPVLRTADALLGSPGAAAGALHRAGRAVRSLQRILDSATRQDLVGVTTRSLRRMPELVDDVAQAVALLDRTYPTLRESLGVQQQTLDILRRSLGIQARTEGLVSRTLGVARSTRDIAASTRDIAASTRTVAASTRDIARATLGHTDSIDRKTGGQLPALP